MKTFTHEQTCAPTSSMGSNIWVRFWHFYSRFPENQRLQRLYNLFKRYFHLLRPWLELPGHFMSQRFLDPVLQAATTVDRFSYLVWSTANGFSALPSKKLILHSKYRNVSEDSSSEFEDDDEGEDEDGEHTLDEEYDFEQTYKYAESVPEDALSGQPIADFLSTTEHWEDILNEHFLTEQLMFLSGQGSSPSPPVRKARAGTPHPSRRSLEQYGNPEEAPEASSSTAMQQTVPPSEQDPSPLRPLRPARPSTPHPGKRPFDEHEDVEEAGSASAAPTMEQMMSTFRLESTPSAPPQQGHDELTGGTSSHSESGISLPSSPKKARQRSPVAPFVNMEPLAAAFGSIRPWPAVAEVAVQRQDYTKRPYSRQQGTRLQFGNEAPYYARFNGEHWVLTPHVRGGKRHQKIVTTHRGLQETGSKSLWQLTRWDARKNYIRYIPKDDPFQFIQWPDPKGKTPIYRASDQPPPPTQWFDAKGKTPVYKAFSQTLPAQPSDPKGKLPVYRETRIDSVVSDLRRVSIAEQAKRKPKTRRWTIDIDRGQLRRIPCCKRSEAPKFHDLRFKHLADLQDYDIIFGLGPGFLPVFSPVAPRRAPLTPAEEFHLRMATQMQLKFMRHGNFRSWQPISTQESRPPGSFDPFDAANRARWYEAIASYVPPKRMASVHDQTTDSRVTELEGESSLTFPPNLKSVAVPVRNPEAGLSDEILVDTQMWRDWQEPELMDTVALSTIEESKETFGLDKAPESRVFEVGQDPVVMVEEMHYDEEASGQPPGEPMEPMMLDPQPESSFMVPQPSAPNESYSFGSAGEAIHSPQEDADFFATYITDDEDNDVGMDFQRPTAELLQRKKADRRRKGGQVKFPRGDLRGGNATILEDIECDDRMVDSIEMDMIRLICVLPWIWAAHSFYLLIRHRRRAGR
ncbi:MAG: hypothetical protein Q9165_008151 [Trypethelium subeluteriae]